MNRRMPQFGNIREVRHEDLELMLSWRNAPEVSVNMFTRHEISISEHLAWWEATQHRPDKKYYIYELDSMRLGVVCFTDIDRINNNSSWAFYAAPGAPKGTGSKMEFLALAKAFDELSLHRLYCAVLGFNTSVIRLHQKFGFRIEGILREHHRIDEEFVDVYRLGLLAHEWAEQQAGIRDMLSTYPKER